jgi:hypothetical protein
VGRRSLDDVFGEASGVARPERAGVDDGADTLADADSIRVERALADELVDMDVAVDQARCNIAAGDIDDPAGIESALLPDDAGDPPPLMATSAA